MNNTELKYYKDLDGLRGMAALMVMWFHSGVIAGASANPLLKLMDMVSVFGQTGVTLFFVLSGFLITRILFRDEYHAQYFRNFYAKRSLRIFPLYYLGLAVYWFAAPGSGHWPKYWMYLLYLQNCSDTFNWGAGGPQHFWSLAVEEHFYLFWPVLIYITPRKHFIKLAGALIVVAFLCRIVMVRLGYGTFYFTFSTMDCLVIGALLAWAEAEGKLYKLNFWVVILSCIAILLPAWLAFRAERLGFVQVLKLPLISLFYAGIIGLLISRRTWLNWLFGSAFFRFTGKISYGLYVWHPLSYVLFNYFVPGTHGVWGLAGCFGCSYLLATVSFYLYERHFIKLKKRFELKSWQEKQELQFK